MIINKVPGKEIEFIAIGDMWSTYINEGRTLRVYMCADKARNFTEFAKDTSLNGPNLFQCTGFNNGTVFRITGVPDGESIDILE